MPIGGDLKKGLEQIYEYANCQTPNFWVQNDGKFDELKNSLGEWYDISPVRDAFDYIAKDILLPLEQME